MKPTVLILAALAIFCARSAYAQSDFLTLQENVDPSGTALMCPTRPNTYVDCADVEPLPGAPGTTSASVTSPASATSPPLRFSAHRGRERHRHREAAGRAWEDRLYLHAHGERHHRERRIERPSHSHSRGMWVE
jgi:hypothetical protein